MKAFAKKLRKSSGHKRLKLVETALHGTNYAYFLQHFGPENAAIRNSLAHFSVLKPDFTLTEQINRVRSLMAYDRKLKNSVSKAMKDILADEGIRVTWSTNGAHNLVKPPHESVRAETINHLKFLKNIRIKISTNRVSDQTRTAVAALLFGADSNPQSSQQNRGQPRHDKRPQGFQKRAYSKRKNREKTHRRRR